MLHALESALMEWSEETQATGHPLADEVWHIGDRYDKIREAITKYPVDLEGSASCEKGIFSFIPRLCKVHVNAATEFTPRAKLEESSIRHLLVPVCISYLSE